MGDDAINIHGESHIITACEGRTLRVLPKTQTMSIEPGDSLELWSYTGERLTAVAVNVSGPLGGATAGELAFLAKQAIHAPY